MRLDDINEIGIIGLGTMGAVFAQIFAQAGYRVMGYEANQQSLQTARNVIRTNLTEHLKRAESDSEDLESVMARIQYRDNIGSAVEYADIVIEAVNENRETKETVFREIDSALPEQSRILSNTSTLDIYPLVPERRLPNTIIAHWFAPPHIIPLVEVVKGPQTSDETAAITLALMEALGKVPVLIKKFVPGFVINRILRIIGREVFHLLEEDIISPEQLDLAVKASIAPRMMVLGLVQRYDFTGLDLSARNLTDEAFYDPPYDNEPEPLVSRVKRGELGVKAGKGFYDYSGRNTEDILRERDTHLKRVFENTAFCLEKKRLV